MQLLQSFTLYIVLYRTLEMHICSLKKGCDLFLNLIKDIDTGHDHQKSIVAEVFGDCISESIHFLGANIQLCIAP
jgi:hypothetical protein